MNSQDMVLYDKHKNKLIVKKPSHMIAVHKKYLLVQGSRSIIVVKKVKSTLVVQKPKHIVLSRKNAVEVKKTGYLVPRER